MADNWNELNRQKVSEAMNLLYLTFITDQFQADARGAAVRALDELLLRLGGVKLSEQIEAVPWSKRMRGSGDPDLARMASEAADKLAGGERG